MSKLITTCACALFALPALSAQSPDAFWPGKLAFDQAGSVVEVIGDCDADGTPDIAIGAPHADQQISFPIPFTLDDVGHVQVISGASGDVLFNLWGTVAGDEFGFALSNAGDVDQDGHDDLLIGVPRATFNKDHQGKVQVRSGATGVLIRTNWGPQSNDRFGHSVSWNGLVTSVYPAGIYAVGAPLFDADDSTGGFGQEGLVRSFAAHTGASLWNHHGGTHPGGACSCQTSDYEILAKHFGWSVAFEDSVLAIGAPLSDRRNTVTNELEGDTGYVLLMNPAAPSSTDRRRYWGAPGARAGTTVDNLEVRVAVGSPGVTGNGRVDVFSVDLDLPFSKLDLEFTVEGTAQRQIGDVVSYVGFVDDDTASDLAIGSPNTSLGQPFGTPGVGATLVVSGADGSTIAEYVGLSANDHLGSAVAGADLNGDGYSDIVVGVTGADTIAGIDSGAAWFYNSHPCPADSMHYGTGHPGTNGTPAFLTHGNPKLGANYKLLFTNSLGAPTQAWFFLGFAPASIPLKDGTLLVDIFQTLTFPMGSGTLPLNPDLPDDPKLCGVSVFLQGLVIDPGASRGVAFSKGLELQLGY